MRRHVLYFIILLLLVPESKAEDEDPVVAVAASFSPALEEIVRQFTNVTGQKIRITVGASGTLYRQIELGAPFELFLPADEEYATRLYEKGLTPDNGHIYATGKLVLYIPYTTRLDTMQSIQNILKQIVSDKSYRIAMANPELAPYGLAAKQVISGFTTYNTMVDRIILGENVGQTAQFALTGSVDAAFLPYSLTISNQMQQAGHFELLPDDWYRPITQRMVLLNNAGKPARALYDYIQTDKARSIILKYGYTLPDY